MTPSAIVAPDLGSSPEGWNEPDGRGVVGWQTMISGDTTPTDALTCGLATVAPGGFLALHRHEPAEIYLVHEGEGIVTIDGVEHRVKKGDCVYIPSMAEHGCRQAGEGAFRFFYVFSRDAFSDVIYLFSGAKGGEAG
jgi:Mannose-6-phosphate isomerase